MNFSTNFVHSDSTGANLIHTSEKRLIFCREMVHDFAIERHMVRGSILHLWLRSLGSGSGRRLCLDHIIDAYFTLCHLIGCHDVNKCD